MAQSHLRKVAAAREAIERGIADRNAAMQAARDSGETWADIASAAGLTPNGVRHVLGFRRTT